MSSELLKAGIQWIFKKKVKIKPEPTEIIFQDTVFDIVMPYVNLKLLRIVVNGSMKVNLKSLTVERAEKAKS